MHEKKKVYLKEGDEVVSMYFPLVIGEKHPQGSPKLRPKYRGPDCTVDDGNCLYFVPNEIEANIMFLLRLEIDVDVADPRYASFYYDENEPLAMPMLPC
jgi:hypothetical protein